MGIFFAKSSWSVLDDAVTERADIRRFGSTVGYNVTPHYQLPGSLQCYRNVQKLAAENRGEDSAYNDPTNLLHRFSIMRGPRELLFFQLVVLLHRSNRYSNSCWAHRMCEISSHKVTSISSPSTAKI